MFTAIFSSYSRYIGETMRLKSGEKTLLIISNISLFHIITTQFFLTQIYSKRFISPNIEVWK